MLLGGVSKRDVDGGKKTGLGLSTNIDTHKHSDLRTPAQITWNSILKLLRRTPCPRIRISTTTTLITMFRLRFGRQRMRATWKCAKHVYEDGCLSRWRSHKSKYPLACACWRGQHGSTNHPGDGISEIIGTCQERRTSKHMWSANT